jgi:predicted ribosomally synthesized peptide with SipW-like signal peptide
MSDDNNGSFELSRRKALAGLGGIGTATALGGIGTYAQFTDTEEQAVTFTAGGIDGELTWSGSYNGNPVEDGLENVTVGPSSEGVPGGVEVDVAFTDVKPGDFGCVNFGITVANNPAWVAACLDVVADTDGDEFEPEAEIEDPNGDGTYEQGDFPQADEGDPQTDSPSSGGDLYGRAGKGELAENIYTLPYYDSDGECVFFDPDEEPTFDPESIGDFTTPSAFWSNSQPDGVSSNNLAAMDTADGTEYYLAPRSLRSVSSSLSVADTAHWNSNSKELTIDNAPAGTNVDLGCMMLDGEGSNNDSNNTQGVAALQSGTTLNFGYDFHMPFATGNEVQGDKLTLKMGFIFLQTRHTEAPDFGTYSPASNTPNGSS